MKHNRTLESKARARSGRAKQALHAIHIQCRLTATSQGIFSFSPCFIFPFSISISKICLEIEKVFLSNPFMSQKKDYVA